MAQAVGLVPAGGEDVEGDLAADGVATGRREVVSCCFREGWGTGWEKGVGTLGQSYRTSLVERRRTSRGYCAACRIC